MKTNDNVFEVSSIVLPLPPTSHFDDAFAMEIYARFMRQLRYVPTSRADIQVLTCIQFAADMMDISDAQVAKVLVDLGLRAPRSAFPIGYLSFVDRCSMQCIPHNDSGSELNY